MIVKQTPDDFQVEELTDCQPGAGPFAFYRLEKSGWTTPDALQAIRRRWRLDHRRLSYGGLKDRHAHTIQYFTVFRGPQRKLTHQGFSVAYLGQLAEPYGAGNIRANRFRMVLRDVHGDNLPALIQACAEVRDFGVPNYFDDQRFGSVAPEKRDGEGGKFLAKSIILGDYEEALRLALTAHYAHDRRPQKKEKAILRAHWGDWVKCKDLLAKSHARSLVDYLVSHPADFHGALERLRPELRGLYLSAYQSHLWNRMLAAWLAAHVPAERLMAAPLKLGEVPMHRVLDAARLAELSALTLPLHSHRVVVDQADPRRPFFEQILQVENLTLEQFKLKGFREMFFSRGERAALCLPGGLSHEVGPDEAHARKQKLTLSFELPRGTYATLIVKRLSASELA